MDHPICTERDQALLCAIVGAANERAKTNGGKVTRRLVMTAYCYGKIAGIPIDHHFLIYPHGPLAADVLLDIEALELDGALKDVSLDPERGADYIPHTSALSLCVRYKGFLDLQRARIRRVLAALEPFGKERLAQVAALHYLFLHLQRSGEENVMQQTLGEFLAAREGEGWQINPEEAGCLYDRMAAAGLVSY